MSDAERVEYETLQEELSNLFREQQRKFAEAEALDPMIDAVITRMNELELRGVDLAIPPF